MEQFLEDIKDLEVTTVARAQEAIDQKETATFFYRYARLVLTAGSSLLS